MTNMPFRITKALRIATLVGALMALSTGASQAYIAPAVKVGAKYLDNALEIASKVSWKTLTPAGRKLALTQLRNTVVKHGDEAILAARKGGFELLAVAEKHGDDVWKFASRVPSGARALAMRPRELLPLTRRIGTEVLELEAKSPGITRHVVKNFGDDGVRYFAKHVPTRDAARLVGYVEKADSPATRRMLLDHYKKGGTLFLEKLKWKQIMAGGLSAGAITAAYQISDGIQEGLMTVAKSSPETFHITASHTIDRLTQPIVVPATFLGIGLASIWLFRYYRKTRKRTVHA